MAFVLAGLLLTSGKGGRGGAGGLLWRLRLCSGSIASRLERITVTAETQRAGRLLALLQPTQC